MENKSILVVGGTGYLGGKVINHLLKQNVKVSALVRATSNTKELESKGVTIVVGDISKPETLAPALKNIDAVISTAIGYSNRKKGDNLKSVDDAGNRNLVDVIKEAKIKRFVFTSVLNVHQAESVPHFWQKKLIEDYMEEKGIPFISLRPGAFLDQSPNQDFYAGGLKKGSLRVMGSTSIKWTNILSEDLAKYLAIAAMDERIPNGRIDIGMNEPMNPQMLASFASEYSGKQIKVSALPWSIIGSVFSFAGVFKSEMYDLKKMFDYMFTGKYVADTSLQQKYFGEVPTVKDSVYRYCEQIGLPKNNKT